MVNPLAQKNPQKRSFANKMLHAFKGIDIYGKPIVMTYDGADKFKTFMGAVISLLIMSTIFVYFLFGIRDVVSKSETSMSKNTIFTDLENDKEVHYIGEKGIMFGFSIDDDNGGDLIQQPSYVSYSFKQVSQTYTKSSSGDSERERIKTTIENQFCGNNSFTDIPIESITRLGIDKFHCPKYKNYTVAGNYYSERFDYIEIKFYKCNPAYSSVPCASDIDDVLTHSKLTFSFQNTFFDLTNFTDPAQNYLDGQFYWDIMPGFRKKNDIYIRKNEATLHDQLVQLFNTEERNFYQIQDSRDQIELEGDDGQFASIYIRFDPYRDQYDRRVFSFGDLMGQVGGIYEVLLLTGMLVVGIFSERLLISSILNKIYQIDKTREKQIVKNKNTMAKTFPLNMLNTGKNFGKSRKELVRAIEEETPPANKRDIFMNKIKHNMQSRSKFRYGYREIFGYIFCCAWIRPKRKMRKNALLRKQVYFKNGSMKLKEELDCISVIKSIRQLKVISRILLSRQHNFFMRFNQKNVINSSSDSSDEEFQLGAKQTLVEGTEKMNNKIEKLVELYRRKEMNEIEKKILKGVIQENMSDGNEGLSSEEEEVVLTESVYSRGTNNDIANIDSGRPSLNEEKASKKHKRVNAFGERWCETFKDIDTKSPNKGVFKAVAALNNDTLEQKNISIKTEKIPRLQKSSNEESKAIEEGDSMLDEFELKDIENMLNDGKSYKL
ncbi:unnamed protein product [Moneuplotes crassus]|uniref:Uncharacterized protein n=1 Tax=Euplotes crassus TaxID=5936 RepID=A0AAD1Y300_EUPCR|nr:unnamed protein product [Moneuplotes crassus]